MIDENLRIGLEATLGVKRLSSNDRRVAEKVLGGEYKPEDLERIKKGLLDVDYKYFLELVQSVNSKNPSKELILGLMGAETAGGIISTCLWSQKPEMFLHDFGYWPAHNTNEGIMILRAIEHTSNKTEFGRRFNKIHREIGEKYGSSEVVQAQPDWATFAKPVYMYAI